MLLITLGYGVNEWIRQIVREERQRSEGHKETPEPGSTTAIAGLVREATNEEFYRYFSKRYGFAYEELLVHGTLNEHGAVKVWRKSKVIAHVAGIDKLDQYLISESPDEKKIQVDLKCDTQSKKITGDIQRVSSQELNLTIKISEPLMPNDELEFSVTETTPNSSMSMTKAELDKRIASGKRFEYESFYWEITRPTKQFQLKLIVPKTLKPEGRRFDVWYGRSRISHIQEFSRISDSKWFKVEPAGDQIELTLDVMYPIPTLIYAIRFIPSDTETDAIH